MNPESWTAVDDYLVSSLVEADPILEQALADSHAAGLPSINVAPNQGKLLHLLVRMIGAKRILEVGTLGGYSTIWLARALPPEGRVITLEYEPRHAEVAHKNLARAGLSGQVEVQVGRAIDLLPKLEPAAPFDFVFIDADKPSNPDYFAWALKLTRPGSVIVVDNVVRSGAVVEPQGNATVQGIRRMMEMIAAEPRVTATAIQTVGSKGWDGFCLIRVVG
ncbi:O-methyltransferase [Hyalangium versicolor]|uniref:O-methyltransferase n=1 Tax=Hyalangium versicolor TaxID=2861190 RepID=UPI001CD001A8|nr:O-methyltransferase [Hyalangium versicolor]